MDLLTGDWFNLLARGYLDRLSRYKFTYMHTFRARLMNSTSLRQPSQRPHLLTSDIRASL